MQNGGSVNERAVAKSAALRGASVAFANGRPAVGPKPKLKPLPASGLDEVNSRDGMSIAATRVKNSKNQSTPVARNDEPRLGYNNTGSSVGSYTGRSSQRLSNYGDSNMLQPPGAMVDRTTSASYIAASLAASRSPSISPNPTGQQVEAKKQATSSPSTQRRKGSLDLVDDTSVPPTNRLIGMFEGNSREVRAPLLRMSNTSATVRKLPPRPSSPKLVMERSPQRVGAGIRDSNEPEIKLPKATLPRPPTDYFPTQSEDQTLPTVRPKPSVPRTKPIPIPAKLKRPDARRLSSSANDAASDGSFKSASSQFTEPVPSPEYKPSFRATLAEQRRLTSPSTTSLTSTSATIDSMANAIVASSLASSRAASPSKSLLIHNPYPPIPPPRKTGRSHIFHSKAKSRTPSPAKPTGMKTTLRKVKSQDSIDEGEKRRGKKSLVKKHPHKHHEGDRKRWRDSITERERKRYEAVWASNRGLWLGEEDADRVCGLVVRDVWSRSRLNLDVLQEVFALIDRSGKGNLGRDEFVVGMWLVDQWLKGRKLPIRVGESVWRSVGGTGGIKVQGPRR